MAWLRVEKCPVKNSDIYLEFDDFKKVCRDLKVNARDNWIEEYERHGLLYPCYRVNRPKAYLQRIFEQTHGPGRFRNVIEAPDEYGTLLKFEYEELDGWHHPFLSGFDKALSEGHPLDQAYHRGEFFIEVPSVDTFKSRNECKVKLEITIKNETLLQTKLIARNFYSPWQIYLLEEANQCHTHIINVLLPLQNKFQEPQRPSLAQWQSYFKALWEYRFKEGLLFRKAFENTKGNILEGNSSEQFHDSCKNVANHIGQRYPYESWISFLRRLCDLYFDYLDREKYRLSQCVKQDIIFLIDILMYSYRKSYREIVTDVGMVAGGTRFFHVSPLERIYPEYESFLKREARLFLEFALDDYNKEVPDFLKLDKNAVDEIINEAFTSGNETLLSSIIYINEEHSSQSYFGNEATWSFMRSLAISFESWVKKLESSNSFSKALASLTGNDFKLCHEQLLNNCGMSGSKVTNYADFNKLLKEVSKINFARNNKNLFWMKHLIRAYLTRNYAAHHTKVESELFGSVLRELSIAHFCFRCFTLGKLNSVLDPV
ncbi:MAG: hypothetical protein MPW16_14870 [Candidatus Manganitrophus sp.]|nr:MAG: hypothetical protein MPW16_14870 [Candidatus Manganitrophus sp.]